MNYIVVYNGLFLHFQCKINRRSTLGTVSWFN